MDKLQIKAIKSINKDLEIQNIDINITSEIRDKRHLVIININDIDYAFILDDAIKQYIKKTLWVETHRAKANN